MAVTGKQEKTKYKLAESVKECMKTAPVDKITVKNIVEGCGLSLIHIWGVVLLPRRWGHEPGRADTG